jgi:tetratricopeptide (TPR) repeat protein
MRAPSPMHLTRGLRALALVLATAAGPVLAAESAVTLFEKGEYAAAADAAASSGGTAGFALAARATLADASLRETPCLECLQRAEAYARQAIAAEPNSMEAHIHLAVALGYQARIIGPLRARFQRFPEQAKEAIDTALRLAPDSHWSLSAAGGFNIEVVRSGGRVLGKLLYGASFEDGVSYFQRAMAADPENPLIKLQYALALTGYDLAAWRAQITALLGDCARGPADNPYEQAMRDRARRLLDLLNQDKRQEFVSLARRYQGFPES